LDGATVIVRNQATGAEARTSTARNGTYKFVGLDAGEYTLEADSEQLGQGSLEGILVTAGHESRLQTAMRLEFPPPKPIQLVFHDIPQVAQLVSAALPAEPLQTLSLSGQSLPLREMPVAAPVLTAMLAVDPLRALPLAGRPWPATAQHAVEFAQPQHSPIHAGAAGERAALAGFCARYAHGRGCIGWHIAVLAARRGAGAR
jgi:hypothetical protein